MIPNNSVKRKSSFNASSPPPSRNSPLHAAFSPPHINMASSPPAPLQYGRPMTSAAAAAAAIKRSNSTTTFNTTTPPPQQQPIQISQPYRRQSGSTAPPSRQGSIETDREESVNTTTADDEENISNSQQIVDGKDKDKEKEAAEVEPEDDEKEDIVVDMDAHMQAQMEKAKEDMMMLLENFSPDQLQRYEAYRRSALNRTNVKRLVSQVLNQQISQTMAFVVAGFSKVYVGEIVEKAREIMEEWGHTGAIRPEHLREAHRRYKKHEIASSSLGRKL